MEKKFMKPIIYKDNGTDISYNFPVGVMDDNYFDDIDDLKDFMSKLGFEDGEYGIHCQEEAEDAVILDAEGSIKYPKDEEVSLYVRLDGWVTGTREQIAKFMQDGRLSENGLKVEADFDENGCIGGYCPCTGGNEELLRSIDPTFCDDIEF